VWKQIDGHSSGNGEKDRLQYECPWEKILVTEVEKKWTIADNLLRPAEERKIPASEIALRSEHHRKQHGDTNGKQCSFHQRGPIQSRSAAHCKASRMRRRERTLRFDWPEIHLQRLRSYKKTERELLARAPVMNELSSHEAARYDS
jgi:hypothetical protein